MTIFWWLLTRYSFAISSGILIAVSTELHGQLRWGILMLACVLFVLRRRNLSENFPTD